MKGIITHERFKHYCATAVPVLSPLSPIFTDDYDESVSFASSACTINAQ
jgi:hypothetical protein